VLLEQQLDPWGDERVPKLRHGREQMVLDLEVEEAHPPSHKPASEPSSEAASEKPSEALFARTSYLC
jgi:hypothetical protein